VDSAINPTGATMSCQQIFGCASGLGRGLAAFNQAKGDFFADRRKDDLMVRILEHESHIGMHLPANMRRTETIDDHITPFG
jgi:hypothetical protein